MKPRDLTIDELIAAMSRPEGEPGLRPSYSGGACCLFADGHVVMLSRDTPPETLRAMCTRSGGETINAVDLMR